MSKGADGQADSNWESALDRVRSSASNRGLLRLAVALCRRVWGQFPHDDCRQAVEAVERLANHPQLDSEDYAIAAEAEAAMDRLQRGYSRVDEAAPGPRGAYLAATACAGMWHDPHGMIGQVALAAAIAAAGSTEGPAWEVERRAQAALFGEFVGSPQRPPTSGGM